MSKYLKIFLGLLFVICYLLFVGVQASAITWQYPTQPPPQDNLYPLIWNIRATLTPVKQDAVLFIQNAARIEGQNWTDGWKGLMLGHSNLQLSGPENLLYGVMGAPWAGEPNLLLLQKKAENGYLGNDYLDLLKVDKDGNLTVGNQTANLGKINVAGQMTIEKLTAKLGLGGDNPAYSLDVQGSARITGHTYLATETGRKVGIGTTSPTQKLTVAGNISANVTGSPGQIQVGNFTSAPSAIGPGALYYNSQASKMYYYGGSPLTWQEMGAGENYWEKTGQNLYPKNLNWNISIYAFSYISDYRFIVQGRADVNQSFFTQLGDSTINLGANENLIEMKAQPPSSLILKGRGKTYVGKEKTDGSRLGALIEKWPKADRFLHYPSSLTFFGRAWYDTGLQKWRPDDQMFTVIDEYPTAQFNINTPSLFTDDLTGVKEFNASWRAILNSSLEATNINVGSYGLLSIGDILNSGSGARLVVTASGRVVLNRRPDLGLKGAWLEVWKKEASSEPRKYEPGKYVWLKGNTLIGESGTPTTLLDINKDRFRIMTPREIFQNPCQRGDIIWNSNSLCICVSIDNWKCKVLITQ